MADTSLTIDQVLILLADAPSRIATLTADLSPAQLRTHPNHDPDEWSINDILAHLRSCADMWGDCIAVILAQDKPTLRAINPVTWMAKTDYPELEFQPSFQAFNTQRTELLAVLQPLTLDGWSRSATVTGAGKPLQRTVYFYAQWLAVHERTHYKPITRIVKTLHT